MPESFYNYSVLPLISLRSIALLASQLPRLNESTLPVRDLTTPWSASAFARSMPASRSRISQRQRFCPIRRTSYRRAHLRNAPTETRSTAAASLVVSRLGTLGIISHTVCRYMAESREVDLDRPSAKSIRFSLPCRYCQARQDTRSGHLTYPSGRVPQPAGDLLCGQDIRYLLCTLAAHYPITIQTDRLSVKKKMHLS